MKYLFGGLLSLLLLGSNISGHAQTKAYPRNDLYKDSSLTNFICKLQYAIFKKDKAYLLSIVDPNIKLGFGGDDGKAAFERIWEPGKNDSPIWFTLSKLISLGGTYSGFFLKDEDKDGFVFPYVYSVEITDEKLDVFSVMMVTGENVNVREKPDKTSKVVGKLSYDIVLADYNKSYPAFQDKKTEGLTYYGEKEWYYITTQDQKISGYVYWDYVWSPVGYRLFFNKTGDEWRMTGLIAGD